MFTDLALSRDVMAQYARSRPDAAHMLSVAILEQGCWPFSARDNKTDIVLPNKVRHRSHRDGEWATDHVGEQLQDELGGFESFYKIKQPSRRLNFDVRAAFISTI
jgi:hypothetical protein